MKSILKVTMWSITEGLRGKCWGRFGLIAKVTFAVGLVFFQTGCKKLLQVDAPLTSITSANVYTTDATAASVLTGIYTNISNGNGSLTTGSLSSLSLLPELSADELTLYDINNITLSPYYKNGLTSQNQPGNFWSNLYGYIYDANVAIEGLNASGSLTPSVKQQLLGEALFLRAFFYFYLVNLYGDVPLAVSSDYKVNSSLARASAADIYQQMISDLKQAQLFLSTDYRQSDAMTAYPIGSAQRVRPTKWAASALLSRVYLYTGDYPNAEAQADSVIGNTAFYGLTGLDSAFLENSMETIWSLQPTGSGVNANTGEGALFILPPTGPNTSGSYPVYLSPYLLGSFEPNDQRRVHWVDSVVVGSTAYYYPYKYKIGAVNTPTQEYIMVLRLSEQYLIRSEARAQQGDISGAQSDLNAVRARAGLPATTAGDKASLLAVILHERQVELFTEWGSRWFDLIRTESVDTVLGTPGNVCQAKGGSWNADWQLYPIPQTEINLDDKLTQNAGY